MKNKMLEAKSKQIYVVQLNKLKDI